MPAIIRHGGNRACYIAAHDVICLPPRTAFADGRQYYATLLHELGHWTRHPTRLDRDFGARRFGDVGYAREELFAKLTAAFLGAELGLPVDHIEGHAAYLDHWRTLLDHDPGVLVSAAGKAQAAANYLRQFLAEAA